MNKKPGLVFDNRFFRHVIDRPSPENPERIRRLYHTLNEPKYRHGFIPIKTREATFHDIEAVHSSFYLSQIREHALTADPFSYDRDTYVMDETILTAQLAAGGCLELADRIMAGEIDYGFALVRPPGHHAEPGRGMGFCVFNNVALTAAYLLKQYQLNRILIIDFDAHHGNGTQEIFYNTDKVMVLSLHQKGLFPFTGAPEELGTGAGTGYTINVPVFPQFGDQEYTYIVGRLVQNIVEQYLPQIILVSAGYDGHADDSISSTLLTTGWYTTVTSMLRRYAGDVCGDRLLLILEGGYNPVSLEASVLATLDGLLADAIPTVGILPVKRAEKLLHDHPMREFWTF